MSYAVRITNMQYALERQTYVVHYTYEMHVVVSAVEFTEYLIMHDCCVVGRQHKHLMLQ